MEAVAGNVSDGVKFKGIAYEGEKPSILHRVPSNGLDIQDTPHELSGFLRSELLDFRLN